MRIRDLDLKLALLGYLLLLVGVHLASSCTVLKFKDSTVVCGSPGAVATNVPRPAGPVATGAGSDATAITKPRAAVSTGPSSPVADYTKAGQRADAAAIGQGNAANATTTSGLSYWWLLVPLAALLWWQRKRIALLFV